MATGETTANVFGPATQPGDRPDLLRGYVRPDALPITDEQGPEVRDGVASPTEWAELLRVVGSGLRRALRIGSQCAILGLLFATGTVLAHTFALPLPGNLVGMLLLLLLLSTGALRPAHVEDVAGFVVRHLNFFFIPFVVGLMAWGGLLASSGLVLAGCLIVSAVAGALTAALVATRMSPQGGPPDAA